MNKTFVRILSAILVLCMIPATFLSALAHGPGVSKNETENQSFDNANGQYIPETIQVDGIYDDTGWPIEGWNYVTSSTGNWNVTFPEQTSQGMMYQYQLRADYGYFYGAAVIVLPEGMDDANLVIYLSDAKSSKGYEITTAAINFALNGGDGVADADRVQVSAKDCNTDDALVPNVNNLYAVKKYEKKNGNNVFYLEFSNPVANTYNADAEEIKYYLSLNVYTTDADGESVQNSLYHPIYNTVDGYHAVPTSEFWPGGGALLNVTYADFAVKHGSTVFNDGETDGFKGAIDLDGKFNEEMWKGFTDYYTTSVSEYEHVANENKGLLDVDNVDYIGETTRTDIKANAQVVGAIAKCDFRTDNKYFFGAVISSEQVTAIKANGTASVSFKQTGDSLYRYEFKALLSDFGSVSSATVEIGGTPYDVSVRHYANNVSDCIEDDGNLDEAVWLLINAGDNKLMYADHGDYGYNGNFETLVWDIKADYEYIYGAAIVKLQSGKSFSNKDKLRLWIMPNGVDMASIVTLVFDAENPYGFVYPSGEKYKNSEFVKIEYVDDLAVIELKVPYKFLGWEGPDETAATTNGLKDAPVQPDIADAKDASTLLFGYYISSWNTQNTDTQTFFTKNLQKANALVYGANDTEAARLVNITKITYGDILETVKIDGHIEENVWTGEDVEFYHADFANSTVIDEPTRGKTYDYSYMLYGGSNYIYGAVEFNDDAKEGTTFTLWLNNYIDEFKWIGDNDSKTPHITYDVYPIDAWISKYTGKVTGGSTVPQKENGESVKVQFVTNEIQYYTNYKYEFDLGKVTAKATPDFYFATDSNLESDKIKIVENENYKYAVTTINGKTYLEFMIDVDNFHWDNNSFEYITSMTHKVDASDGASGEQTLTIYHPQINDRSNLWLTNLNNKTATLPDGNGILYTDADQYTLPPSPHMFAYKFEPVEESRVGTTDTYTQYRLIEKKSAYYWYYYDENGKVKSRYNNADKTKNKNGELTSPYYTAEEWQQYTPEESADGIIMFAYYNGQYWSTGHRAAKHDDSILTYTNRRPIDYKPTYDTVTQELYYVAANVYDSNSERGAYSNSIMWAWELGDVVEFGCYDTDFVEDKDEESNVIVASKNNLSTNADIIQTGEIGTMHGIFGKEFVNFSDAIKTKAGMLPVGGDLGFTYKYVTKDPSTFDLYANADTGELIDDSNFADEGKGGKANFGVYTNGNLNDKTIMDNESRVVMYPNRDGERAVTEIIADLTTAKATNVYTAYIEAGHSGMYADQLNMEIYGSNDETNWDFVTSASYRQLILSKGNGYSYSGTAKGSSNPTITSIKLTSPTSGAVSYYTYEGDSAYNESSEAGVVTNTLTDGTIYPDMQKPGTTQWTNGQIILIKNNKSATVSSQKFYMDITLSETTTVDTVTLGLFDQWGSAIGTPGNVVEVYTSETATSPATRFVIGRQMTEAHLTDEDYKGKARSTKQIYKLDDSITTNFVRLEFTFPEYTAKQKELMNSASTDKSWMFTGFSEIDVTRDTYDYYTLTAVDNKTETYRYIKFRFVDTSSNSVYSSHCFGLGELQISDSTKIENLPKKTILHVNTDQGKALYNAGVLQYKGKYNTSGTAWTNDPNDEKYVDHNSISNVMPETMLYPNYALNSFMDTGFYTNYYIERVYTPALDQNDKPKDETTTLDWDGRNSNVLKKLKHIAPDVITVDGSLGDTGWDGTWTDVDGLVNATNTEGTGTDFKYQLRADGEYLYVGAVIELYDDNNIDDTTFTLWLKGDENATTFTHYYKIGANGTTELDIETPVSSWDKSIDELKYLADSDDEQVDITNGKLTLKGMLEAIENNEKTPMGGDNVTKFGYLTSAMFGHTKEIVESTHDGIWVWTADPVTQGFRFAIDQGVICLADETKFIGEARKGDGTQAIVEFKVKLSEFGGEDGFEYFVEASTTNGTTIYPHIYTEDGYAEYHHPTWAWDSSEAIKVTPEDMTGWGIYRMVNDYRPMTSLGAKVSSTYTDDGNLTVRFAARYTEEYIRRIADTQGLDYWDVNDAGIVILPTAAVKAGQKLDITNSNAVYAGAQDIINWQNDTPDEKTNFGDYTSFVFYVNLVGIPQAASAMEFSFCGYIDYYNVTQESDVDNTFYGIPLIRSYDQVWETANEDRRLPDGIPAKDYVPTITYDFDNNSSAYSDAFTDEVYNEILTDGIAPVGTDDDKSASHHSPNGYAALFQNTVPENAGDDATLSIKMTYEKEVTFNALELGIYMVPSWRVAPPETVTVSVKENGEWVEKETKPVYTFDETEVESIGTGEKTEFVVIDLENDYQCTEIMLTFTYSDYEFISGIHSADWPLYEKYLFMGLTEVALTLN